MKRSRFSEEQIIAILKEHEAGMPTAEICRRHGISGATFYKYKAKFGGLEVSEARRLRALEDENAKLKKLLAEAILLAREGIVMNHKKLLRLYREENLRVRRRRGRKRAMAKGLGEACAAVGVDARARPGPADGDVGGGGIDGVGAEALQMRHDPITGGAPGAMDGPYPTGTDMPTGEVTQV